MSFNDLLHGKGIDHQQVPVLRHRPHEPELDKALPWLAEEKPDVCKAYQQTVAPGYGAARSYCSARRRACERDGPR
jgi:hypothetical protein